MQTSTSISHNQPSNFDLEFESLKSFAQRMSLLGDDEFDLPENLDIGGEEICVRALRDGDKATIWVKVEDSAIGCHQSWMDDESGARFGGEIARGLIHLLKDHEIIPDHNYTESFSPPGDATNYFNAVDLELYGEGHQRWIGVALDLKRVKPGIHDEISKELIQGLLTQTWTSESDLMPPTLL